MCNECNKYKNKHEAYEANLSLVESLTKERDFLMGKKGTGSALVAYIRRMHKAEADIQNIETQTAQAIFADLENLPEDQEYVCMDCGDVLGGCKCEHLQAIKRKYLKDE